MLLLIPLFDTEELISYLRVPILDTLSSLPNSEGGIILVSEVCELLLKFMIFWTVLFTNELATLLIF